MPRRQTRVTSGALELAGVDPTPGPDVSDNIQLVYSLGDLSRLMPPLPFSMCFAICFPAGFVGLYSGIDLRPPSGSAIEIIGLYNGGAGNTAWRLGALLTANVFAEGTDFVDPQGYATRCTLRRGTTAVAIVGFDIPATSYTDRSVLPIIVTQGNSFIWCNDVANTAATMRIMWREVASPAATL